MMDAIILFLFTACILTGACLVLGIVAGWVTKDR